MSKTQPTKEQFGALQQMFSYFNRVLFGGELPPVLLNFSRHAKFIGFFAPQRWQRPADELVTHEISLNPARLSTTPPKDTASTLVHEMCHLWQQEKGKPPRRGYHNRQWCEKMRAVGLIPVNSKTGEDCDSAPACTHRIQDGGRFDAAFEEMPWDYLLPWHCADEERGKKKKASKKNKVKYTCPTCEANVWGKPKLAILCGECGIPYESDEDDEDLEQDEDGRAAA